MPVQQWQLASSVKDAVSVPVSLLDGTRMGLYTMRVYLGSKNAVGATYFKFVLQDGSERETDPFVIGLVARGEYPAYNWIEVAMYRPQVPLLATDTARAAFVDLQKLGLEDTIFGMLGDQVPPGGHLMWEYESPEHEETRTGLERGFPAVVTPLGYLLYRLGCGLSIRDWWFAEGGAEGPRKLDGYRPLNQEQAQVQAAALLDVLNGFMEKYGGLQVDTAQHGAVERAMEVMQELRQPHPAVGEAPSAHGAAPDAVTGPAPSLLERLLRPLKRLLARE